MTWDSLTRELDRWADAGRIATLWWRDDDAERASLELDRLLDLAESHRLGPAIAVIPAGLDEDVQPRLARVPRLAVLQHGFRHASHAPSGAKKTELGPERPAEAVAAELVHGREQLGRLFGQRFLPILVPPWNRIAEMHVPTLPGLGFQGLSTFGGRRTAFPLPGLLQVNTHIDPVDWTARRFLGLGAALGLAIDHLEARRLGRLDAAEPTGLLTHHRMHDGETWAFLSKFFQHTCRHPAARWLGPAEAFSDATRVMVA